MAFSSGRKGFYYRKSLLGLTSEPVAMRVRLDNSATLTIGDAVRFNTSGLLELSINTEPVLGVLVGFTDNSGDAKSGGINPLSSFYVNNTGATLTPDDTVVTASDNSTRTNYLLGLVQVDPSGSALFYNDSDGTLAQTNLGQYFDVISTADQISASSASDANGQWQLIDIDPDNDADASKGLFRINESQFSAALDSATSKITS